MPDSNLYQNTFKTEEDLIEEDKRAKVIEDLEDPEEVDAAIELLSKKIDESEKDNSSGKAGSEKPEKDEDNPPEPTEAEKEAKAKADQDADDKAKAEKEADDKTPAEKLADAEVADKAKEEAADKVVDKGKDEFKIDDEFIQKQPEADKAILNNYKDKTRAELATAAANAIAIKNPYLKDNAEGIKAIADRILAGTDEELIKTFVDTQRDVGKPPEESSLEKPGLKPEPIQFKLPELDDNNPEIKKVLDDAVIKRLKRSYPEMPEDMTSPEFIEWERDLRDELTARDFDKYLSDLKTAETVIKSGMQTMVLIEQNLPNLYNDSPEEVAPFVNEKSYPLLKQLNDDSTGVNNKLLEGEINLIKEGLKNYKIEDPKELGIDLTLVKDKNGFLFNETLNSLQLIGKELDPNVVNTVGKVKYIRKGSIAANFLKRFNPEILNYMVNRKAKTDKVERDRIKEESLNQVLGGGKGGSGSKVITAEMIENTDDPEVLAKIEADLGSRL